MLIMGAYLLRERQSAWPEPRFGAAQARPPRRGGRPGAFRLRTALPDAGGPAPYDDLVGAAGRLPRSRSSAAAGRKAEVSVAHGRSDRRSATTPRFRAIIRVVAPECLP